LKKEAAITANATNALRGRLEENDVESLSPAKMSAADDSYLATRLREVASTAPSNKEADLVFYAESVKPTQSHQP
jgi:hypothetical protein